jgi:hypothetical protein
LRVLNDSAIWKNLNSPRPLSLIAGLRVIPKNAVIPHGTVI